MRDVIDRHTLQQYVNNFRRHFAPHLRPSIGLACEVFPVWGPGALLEFSMGPEIANEDHFRDPMPSINLALTHIRQRAFGGNLAGFRFEGTNIVAEDNRVILLKGSDSLHEWSDKAAFEDVTKIVQRRLMRGARS
jgi:hypothetical protein